MATHLSGPLEGYAATPGYQSGAYYGPLSTGINTVVETGQTLRLSPFMVTRPVNLDRLAIEVTTLGADAGVLTRLGIYRSERDGMPGLLFLDAGVVPTGSADGTGAKQVTISLRLNPGLYWLASLTTGVSGTGPTLRTTAIVSLPLVPLIIPGNFHPCGWQQAVTGTSFPGLASGLSNNLNIPRLQVRAA